MPVATPSAFLEVLEKSRLLPADQLKQLRESLGNLPDGKSAAVRLVKEGVLTRWQAGALLAGSTNLTVGKYHLLSQLGSGKTGRVFLARHAEMERQVAIKILPRRADASATNLHQFQGQARAVSSLDHPNLIHTFDVDSEADQFYLVMEHFPGVDLASLVEKEGPLDFPRAADIVRQAAEGLAHAAEKGMTHGDIRPESIAVDHTGRVKVLHLGMVELAGVALRTLNKKDPASADYAAPEFTGGNATPASDLYSLGCVFFFLLTGKPPFRQGDFQERRRQHQSVPPAAITALRPDAPGELAKICQKMMAKKPENRPESASAAASLLAAWLEKNPAPKPAEAGKSDRPRSKGAPLPAAEKPVAKPAAAAPKAAGAPAPNFNFEAPKSPAAKGAGASAAKNAGGPAAKAAAAPASGDAAAPQPAKKKKKGQGAKKPLDKRWLIGLGAGGGVALLAIVAIAAFLIFGRGGGGEDQVAQAPSNTPSEAEGESDADLLDDVLGEESLDGDLFSSSGEPAAEEAAPPAADNDAAPEENLLAANTPAEPAGDASAPEPAAEATSGAEAQPPAPSEETSDPPAEPAPAPDAEASPAAETPTEEPEEAPEKKEPEADESAKPKPEPKPKPKPKAPFAEFAQSAVSLPPLESEQAAADLQPVTLAKVHDDPEAGVFVKLAGGDTAHSGREVFTLEQDEDGLSQPRLDRLPR
jgi:eukaryotic-like serine/threonine-protein kinase